MLGKSRSIPALSTSVETRRDTTYTQSVVGSLDVFHHSDQFEDISEGLDAEPRINLPNSKHKVFQAGISPAAAVAKRARSSSTTLDHLSLEQKIDLLLQSLAINSILGTLYTL